jgi:hypothetical protein
MLQSLQIESCSQFLLTKLLAVKIFFLRRIQAKILNFGSDLAFQIGVILNLLDFPANWIRYALEVE